MQTAAFNTSQAGTVAVEAKSDKSLRYIKTQIAANDRIFAQRQALVELPLKIEEKKAKIENTKARTALAETDKRLKEEKRKGRLCRIVPKGSREKSLQHGRQPQAPEGYATRREKQRSPGDPHLPRVVRIGRLYIEIP